MTEYVTQAEVKKRATANGWRHIADRDGDGQLNTSESAAVDYAIGWAGRQIDAAIATKIEPADARAQQVDLLKDIAIDLAVYRLFTNGGDDATNSIQTAYDDAQALLRDIRTGLAVPGLSYTYPRPAARTTRVPRAYGRHK